MDSEQPIQSEPSIQEKRAALDFALASETLGRSDTLKKLLRFICEAELSGDESQLSEYEIAVSALGRREDFSPTADSTVRSRAFELRRKLERLYTVEAPDYPLRIDLRKGSYRPRFERIDLLSVQSNLESFAYDPVLPLHQGAGRKLLWVVGVSSFLLGISASAFFLLMVIRHTTSHTGHNESPNRPRWTPELRELWMPLLTETRPLVVVYETPLFIDIGPIVGRDRKVETMHDAEASPPIQQARRLFKVPEIFEARRYTDFSIASAMFSIAQLASTTSSTLKAERALDLTNEDVNSSNLILMGRPGAYYGVKGVSSNGVNFVFQPMHSSIENLHPLPGEKPIYKKSGIAESAGESEEYGIVIMMRGPGAGQHTLSLVSAESEMFGPLALFITDPNYAQDLVSRLRLPSGKLPDEFEVLVRAELKARRPIQIQYVAHRVISNRP